MKFESREYKLLVNHEPFANAPDALEAIWDEIEASVNTLPKVRTKGKFDEQESRGISFLDTPDHTLRRNGLVLRQRIIDKTAEYTLKCRSADRYFAAGTDVAGADRLKSEQKLEEDIAPPFLCRFSHSATLNVPANGKNGPQKRPKTLEDAASLFPILATLRVDDRICHPQTSLDVVNNITVDESVWKGGKFVFERDEDDKSEKASVALILWSRGKDRLAVAELSFRIKENEDRFSRDLAASAASVYELLQRLDFARTDGRTKTEYIYRDRSRD